MVVLGIASEVSLSVYRRNASSDLGKDGQSLNPICYVNTPSSSPDEAYSLTAKTKGVALYVNYPFSVFTLFRTTNANSVLLSRKSVIAYLYYDGTESQLEHCRELILDLPGGGFVCQGPLHHEERLHRWTIRTGKPILAVDYSKAPGETRLCGI